MELLTAHLVLRPIEADDLPELLKLHADPEVMRHITAGQPGDPEHLRNEVLPRWLSIHQKHHPWGFFAARDVTTGDFVGWFHLNPTPDRDDEFDLGYRLHRRFWGRGIASAALKEFLDLVKTRPLYAHVAAHNGASLRVLEKCGFLVIGQEPGPALEDGEPIIDIVLKLEAKIKPGLI